MFECGWTYSWIYVYIPVYVFACRYICSLFGSLGVYVYIYYFEYRWKLSFCVGIYKHIPMWMYVSKYLILYFCANMCVSIISLLWFKKHFLILCLTWYALICISFLDSVNDYPLCVYILVGLLLCIFKFGHLERMTCMSFHVHMFVCNYVCRHECL